MAKTIEAVKATRAACYVPFAGYFTEAHAADNDIRRINIKNTPEEVAQRIRKACPDTDVWIPLPGMYMTSLPESGPPILFEEVGRTTTTSHCLKPIKESLKFQPLQDSAGLLDYFRWSGYRGDLILHIIETGEDFSEVIRECVINLSGPTRLQTRPTDQHRYKRMRVRADVFRFVLKHGLPWEEISIKFEAQFYREPDVYNFDFWDHFQNHLPRVPLWNIENESASQCDDIETVDAPAMELALD